MVGSVVRDASLKLARITEKILPSSKFGLEYQAVAGSVAPSVDCDSLLLAFPAQLPHHMMAPTSFGGRDCSGLPLLYQLLVEPRTYFSLFRRKERSGGQTNQK